MAIVIRRRTILVIIIVCCIGYLLHLPNGGSMEQTNRIRLLTAPMKLCYFISMAAESLGLSDRAVVTRKIIDMAAVFKDTASEDANLQITNTYIENVRVRIARPSNDNSNLPVIIFFHGGAFYMGSIDTHNALTSTLARLANVVVISVNYRLTPKHPFPAGLEDCYTVVKYILDYKDSQKLRIDPTRVAISGDSSGGNFATVITMRLATRPVTQFLPRLQILLYPSLQVFDMMLPSHRQEHYTLVYYDIHHLLSIYLNKTVDKSIYANNHTSVKQKKHYRKFIDWSLIPSKYRIKYQESANDDHEGDPNLIKETKKALGPEISPLLVNDAQLAKSVPTYVLTVGHDRLRDEGFIYAGRLKRVGVKVVHNHYENTFHGSISLLYGLLSLDIAHEMVADLVRYIKENL
ncbi:unnamed protein product [Rotaria magnacalcarata]|uniref:Alpha/beta hydrolase fold-3 domain-containing protein n=3 Tax=Rotaria magnacalcarata TaxID=392030 RepID=A0A814L0U4_9BILA|nr:unnamed protein product [Rotaria magnacalcarata]